MNTLKVLFLFLITSFTVSGQELYTPRNIKNAYDKGTRSYDGNPGKNYWQNHGKYDIQVSVDEKNKIVTGKETITYTNNSPDTLKSAAIRFVNNIHKPEAPRAGYVVADYLSSGLKIKSFAINGKTLEVNSSGWGTVASVALKDALLPGQSASFEIEWSYPLSKLSGREGQIDNTSLFVAYAYPRISVYDDYNGWDMIPHTDRTEFYNDFNDYKLAVKAPKNYVVWATGDFLNPDEVLEPEYASRLKKSYTSDEVIHIATAEEMKKGSVTKQKDGNIWKFEVKNISDVTFSLSSSYVWDAASVVVDKKTNRRASVQAAYNEAANDFPHAVEWGRLALDWFSNNLPGVPYPFSKMTAFQGFADMEYPMMINDSSTPDLEFSQFVLNHEVAHTYFPFYMGTNETRYAFMDEGWATTLEYLIGQQQLGKEKAAENYKKFRVKKWISDPSTEEDQPIISMSTQVSDAGYGNNAYGKPSLAYLALKDMLGDEMFGKALRTYMDRWNGKHPIPWDFFYSINDATKQNLNWFWNSWFFSNNYIDLSIAKVTVKGKNYTVSVKNTGGFAVPFDIKITFIDGKQQRLHQTPIAWKNNRKETFFEVNVNAPVQSISLDGGIFMDASPADNVWIQKL
ncbi:M1 family metallopeptidase [Pedobacter foliorum]|uniref:M1 family metallopeptidase n=1 Tax=Pedobacter foliorum TaxID=2739058 RepID=UPI001565AB9E|nr:M1 family metallopeptidase [Pedobacter foliorum]NRF39271.1 M1 family metallopeptidase [Pedobacter foliorum]